MSPIIILLAPEELTDPPGIDLPTPLEVDAHATTLEVDANSKMIQIDGDLEVAFSGV